MPSRSAIVDLSGALLVCLWAIGPFGCGGETPSSKATTAEEDPFATCTFTNPIAGQ
jgi:hypothetical protein